ncbi:hypothetical protein PCORN_01995, partial [Listeria cornellensis FSL F6-0969]
MPPVQTHAAENKLTGSLKATTSQGSIINKVSEGDAEVTGHIPNGAGQTVIVNLGFYYPDNYIGRDYALRYAVTTQADANGNYRIAYADFKVNGMDRALSYGFGMYPAILTVRSMGITAEAAVQPVSNYTGYVNTFQITDRVISGHIDNLLNHPIQVFDDHYNMDNTMGATMETTTDANGNFSVTFPTAVSHGNIMVSSKALNIPILHAIARIDSASSYNATSMNLNTASINTNRGTTGKITATVLPSFVDQTVTYTSSNPSVITVDANGNWTAIASGSASITATPVSNAGLAQSIPVVVTDSAADIARASVNDLFINNNPANHIKDTTNQAAIDAAQAKVNAITNDPTQKAELQTYVDKAQKELNERNTEEAARASVNDLFISNNPANHIKDATNQAAVDAAQVKVNGVTNPTVNAELQGYVDKAQAELNARNALATATAAVNNLFSNPPTNTALKDSTTQAMIDAASALVNALPASTDKTKLQGDITTANTLFNQITQTTIGALTTESTSVSGKGEPNSDIVIKNGTTTIASGKTDSSGSYSFNIAKQAGGSTITATVTKASNGKTSTASTKIVDDAITQTTIGALTTDSTSVSGKGEANSAIVIKNGTTTIASGQTDSAGNYSFIIAKQAGGSTITATVTKASNGKTSTASTTIADDDIVQTTIGALTTDSTSVSGKGEPNSNIVIKNGTTTIASGKTDSAGNYSFIIAKQAGGSTISATVTKASNGKISTASTTIADDTIAQTTIGALTTDSTSVSGTGEANSAIVIKNGTTTIASGKTDSAGDYIFNITKQAGGSTITATVTKASNGKTSTASTKIADDAIVQTTIGALTTSSTSVSGKGEPNSAIVIKNGTTTIASGQTDSAGNYSFIIAKQAGGSTITATVTKASTGKTSAASTTIPDVKDYALTANSYKIGTANLTGTYGKDIAKVRLFVNDQLIVQATTSNGTFTFANIASFITKPTDKVEVVGVDSAYVERARKTVTVTGTAVYDYSLTANDYTIGDPTLTGLYGKDVSKVRLWVNGVAVTQATTHADGTYTFDKVASFVKLATDKVEVVAVNAAYNEVARKTVVTKGSSILDTSLTPDPYAKDSATLTGKYGK